MKGRFRKGKKAAKKFDGFEWNRGTSGKQRALYYRYWNFHNARLDEMEDEFASDFGEDEFANHWCCGCGHYEESGLHCSVCGAEPPWGCDCSFCNNKRIEDDEEIYFGIDYGFNDMSYEGPL